MFLGERILGQLDYLRFPDSEPGFGGPFNGQPARQELFREIISRLQPKAIVETGTHRGTTTEFMARTGLAVHTIELDPRRYGFARARFRFNRQVNVLHADSRAALEKLFDSRLRHQAGSTIFFYLDAHWNDDLPLAEEIEIIFHRCPAAIVMIDDFEVPFDLGYQYDDYGPGRKLNAEYVDATVSTHRLQAFYPSTPAAEEGGQRRGCVVLAKAPAHSTALTAIPLLRRAAEAEHALPNGAYGRHALPETR